MKLKLISVLMIAVLLLTACGESADGGSNIIHVTQENFDSEVLKSDKTVIMDFYADWCGPCKMLAPILEEIAAERTDVKIVKIDVDEESTLVSMFGIEAMPTLVVLKDGNIVNRKVGFCSKSEILSMLK